MTLRAEAARAIDLADAFSKFRDPVAHQGAEITAAIAELNNLSNALQQFDDFLRATDGRTIAILQDDLNLVHTSISYTLEHIWTILGQIGHGSLYPSPDDYRHTWKEIVQQCRSPSIPTLSIRLKTYKLFVLELCANSRRRPANQRLIENLRGDIRELCEVQDQRLITAKDSMAGLTVDTASLPRAKSYERDRPLLSPILPREEYTKDFLPAAPEVPTSPTGTISTTSWSSSGVIETSHWAREVFRDIASFPSTSLPKVPSRDKSVCYGESMQDAKRELERRFEELFKITFGQGLCVRFYHRERDHRAKILCETPERSGHFWYSCLPLNALHCQRDGSALYLCQPRPGSRPLAWAILQFTTMERLVLFYCTFLSLRSHDNGRPFTNIQDHEMKEEDEEFGGEIRDDGYIHALRICRDQFSRSIRLQASVWLGDMKNTPVWTAFITHHIYSPTWQRRANRSTVCLKELRRHVFSPRYEAPITASGEHVLEFTSDEDATDFMRVVDELAGRPRRC